MRDTTSERMDEYQQSMTVRQQGSIINRMIGICERISNAARAGQYGDWDTVCEQASETIANMRKQQDTLAKAIAHMEDIAATAAKAKETGRFVTETTPTTVKEWNEVKGLRMVWCNRNEADCDDVRHARFETDDEYYAAIDKIRLDYRRRKARLMECIGYGTRVTAPAKVLGRAW